MSYTPQQLSQLAQMVQFYGQPGAAVNPGMVQLGGFPGQSPQSGSGGALDPASLSKMLSGLMGGGGGVTPPNPYAGGGGGYMDAGSMPNYNMA